MNVLVVNWSWYPSGGDWTYVENLIQLYEMNGFNVIPFSTKNEKNIPSKFPDYFVESPDFKILNRNKNIGNAIKAVSSSVVSTEALKVLDQILLENDISIAHLHNIHYYLTPAIVKRLKEHNVKVIWTQHDYKIICPEHSFVSNGKVCEKCMTGNFYNCAINKCKKNSFAASLLTAIEAYYYHSGPTYDLVDAYLCPSNFLYSKFIEFGFDPAKLFVTSLCYNIDSLNAHIDEFLINSKAHPDDLEQASNYILYVGRLEYVKGVKTLIDAVKGTEFTLKIAGTGTIENELKQYIDENAIKNVFLLGFKDKQSIYKLTFNAKFVICPSEWYENFPFSITESFLISKPVIGARIGGIPELVIDGVTGLLFEPGNVVELRNKIATLWNDIELSKVLGLQARDHAIKLFGFDLHWSKLHSIIKSILK
jgi:glycosyltransferase involved in cell wall biosynthesis